MELLRRSLLLVVLFALPLAMGNKSCEGKGGWDHPILEKGAECSTCHEDGRTKDTKPSFHDVTWKREHGSWIRRYGLGVKRTCNLCHTESQCTSCHQQEAPADHTEFWRLKGHGIGVGLDRRRCFACHRSPDFCQRCHSQTTPTDHSASWGAPSNQHCSSCHFPLTSVGAQKCAVCHTSTTSHSSAPAQPSTSPHVTGANCRGCHTTLRHVDNGVSCTVCHTR